MTPIPFSMAKSTVNPEYSATSIFDISDNTSFAIETRSCNENIGFFSGFAAIATTTESNIFAARDASSLWPSVIGSNVPGYIAFTDISKPR